MNIPEVHFGNDEDDNIDWRKVEDDSQDDDEILKETPQDVIDLLGFDPLEIKEETTDANELKKGEHWVTTSKEGGSPRRILLNAKGEIVGGDVPKEQQGKKIDKAAKEQSKESSAPKKEEKKVSPNQSSLEETFGDELAMEFRINKDISKSPKFKEIGEKFSSQIEKETGNNISTSEACSMIKAVKDYAGSLEDYKNIRKGIPPETAEAIEKLISVSQKFKGKVYRGMSNLDSSFIEKLKIGSQVDMKGFSSWSSDKKHSMRFANKGKSIIFEMENKSGVSITNISKDYNEKEILVSGKSKIIISSIKEEKGIYYVRTKEI